jgi:hypothetical protein
MKLKIAVLASFALVSLGSIASAATINLTTSGSVGTFSAGTDFFQQISPSATGSGLIDSFVRISTSADIVQGYNTDARPLQFDENSSPTFTHSLLLSEVPIVTSLQGVQYRQFMLDINQTGSDPLLSLNELQVFLGDPGDLSGATVGAGGLLSFADANLVYDMDSTGDNTVELNYNLNTGSGSGDMFFYVRNSLFTGSNTFVYLYSSFGAPNNNNDGFEEWAVLNLPGTPTPFDETPSVPEPGSLLLLGSGLALAARRLRQKKTTTA